MIRCPTCGHLVPMYPEITGVWRGLDGKETDVAFKCACGHNGNIPWSRATMKQQADARQAEIDGMRVSAHI